ncbi:MAG: AbiV family abortive infection protein [Gracilimonas sp.]|uniref:AbiV family abortive infection protein n=1 Tax=Gracilimonas sp. TaxID=1974203 RepID=UPI0037524FDF|nr:AbiV family abortive infection protein [Gracilimonas sp.]
MVPLDQLSEVAVLAFDNGLRLHFDSILLYENGSLPSSVMLSVLAMEEFGKYFSLSAYVFYTETNNNRNKEFEDNFLKALYKHPFKQKVAFGRDGFIASTDHFSKARDRYYEDLKQRALYVGYERKKGNLLFNKGINKPQQITRISAKEQISFQNELLIKILKQHLDGIIEFDEPEVNEILTSNLLDKLEKTSL